MAFGLGYGNWAEQELFSEFPENQARSYINDYFTFSNLYVEESNGSYNEINVSSLDGIWIDLPKNGYFFNNMGGVVCDIGMYTQIYRVTLLTSYSILIGKPDKGWKKCHNTMFTVGLGWTF